MKNKHNRAHSAAHKATVQIIALKNAESPFVAFARSFFEIFTEREREVLEVYSEMKCVESGR